MNKILVIVLPLMVLSINKGYSFVSVQNIRVDSVYSLKDVDVEPDVEGGMKGLYIKWNSLAKYPIEARKKNIEGKSYISFTVDEDGKIIDPKVERSLGYGCDEAAIEALMKTDLKWTPAIKNGIKVKVRLFLPFSFKLA